MGEREASMIRLAASVDMNLRHEASISVTLTTYLVVK